MPLLLLSITAYFTLTTLSAAALPPSSSERYAYTLLQRTGGDWSLDNETEWMPHPLAALHEHNVATGQTANCLTSLAARRNDTLHSTAAVDAWRGWVDTVVVQRKDAVLGSNGWTSYFYSSTFVSAVLFEVPFYLRLPYFFFTGMSPSTVDELNPHDIDIYAAIGAHSLLTAAHAHCKNLECMVDGAGDNAMDDVAFASGSDGFLKDVVTVPNVLRRYNRHVNIINDKWHLYDIRSSHSMNQLSHVMSSTFFTDSCANLPMEAEKIVNVIQEWDDDYERKWKLITVLVGCGEMQCVCHAENADDNNQLAEDQAEKMLQQVNDTLHVLKQLSRTIVSIVPVTDRSQWRSVWKQEPFCSQWISECYNTEIWEETALKFRAKLVQLMKDHSMHSDSFTAVIQSIFMDDFSNAKMKVEHGWLALDCMRLSTQGHALAARALWNSMLMPVGSKERWDGDMNPEKLLCPKPTCPFIATMKNSIDCEYSMMSRFGRSSLLDFPKEYSRISFDPAQQAITSAAMENCTRSLISFVFVLVIWLFSNKL